MTLHLNTIDESGHIYGDLTVISPVYKRAQAWWLCKCSCGGERVVNGARLRNGNITHCGCKRAHRPYREYVIGQKYNMLTVMEFVRNDKCRSPYFKCKCDCGNEITTRIQWVVSGSTKSCGCYKKIMGNKAAVVKRRLPLKEAVIDSLYNSYAKAAEKRTFIFSLTKEEFTYLIQQNCSYCGSPPTHTKFKRKDPQEVFKTNGIDRVDNKQGYTTKNSVPCCYKCNAMKSALSKDDFIEHVAQINNFQNHIKYAKVCVQE